MGIFSLVIEEVVTYFSLLISDVCGCFWTVLVVRCSPTVKLMKSQIPIPIPQVGSDSNNLFLKSTESISCSQLLQTGMYLTSIYTNKKAPVE